MFRRHLAPPIKRIGVNENWYQGQQEGEIAEEILASAKQHVAVEAERRTIEVGGTDRDGKEFDGSVFTDHIVGVFR
ncbi:MAG: hypothetical protein ACXVAS_18600 [Vulcanimicrobiaceae bacterium]